MIWKRAPEYEPVFTSVYQYYGNSLASFTNTIDDLLLQLPILIKLKVQVPMSLFSIDTVPVPLDAETYIGDKREYTQIILETEYIDDEDLILKEENPEIYAHLENVLVHMINAQDIAISKSQKDYVRNKQKLSEYVCYAQMWQVLSVIFSYVAFTCSFILVITLIYSLYDTDR